MCQGGGTTLGVVAAPGSNTVCVGVTLRRRNDTVLGVTPLQGLTLPQGLTSHREVTLLWGLTPHRVVTPHRWGDTVLGGDPTPRG